MLTEGKVPLELEEMCPKNWKNLVFVTVPFLFPICLKSFGLLPHRIHL